MSFAIGAISSLRNNKNIRKNVGYFRNRGRAVAKNVRTGKPNKKFEMNGDGYAKKKEEEAIELRKGFIAVVILIFLLTVIATLAVYLLQ